MRLRRAVIGLALVALAGCQQAPQTPIPASGGQGGRPNTSPVAPQSVVQCRRSELEQWMQRSFTLMQEFSDTVNSNVATPPDQMGDVIAQLQQISTLIHLVPVPDCAQQHYALVDELTTEVIRVLSLYSSGGQVNLAVFIAETNTRFDLMRQLERELNNVYASLQ